MNLFDPKFWINARDHFIDTERLILPPYWPVKLYRVSSSKSCVMFNGLDYVLDAVFVVGSRSSVFCGKRLRDALGIRCPFPFNNRGNKYICVWQSQGRMWWRHSLTGPKFRAELQPQFPFRRDIGRPPWPGLVGRRGRLSPNQEAHNYIFSQSDWITGSPWDSSSTIQKCCNPSM